MLENGGMVVEGDLSVGDEGDNRFAEGTGSIRVSDVDSQSQSNAEGDSVGGSQKYNFGPSMVIVSRIQELVERGYFAEGGARASGEEMVSEPNDDEAVMFGEFFTAGLRMPLHPVLTVILLKLQMQLHQLTPNGIAQLSKYIWAVASLRGVPSIDSFTKRYELHYQPKKIEVDGDVVEAQFGCLNFHAK
jgi:hypothetical protein